MARPFGKEWIKKLLGIDTFWGRMRFHHRLKKAIALAIASGALVGYLNNANAATPEQKKEYGEISAMCFAAKQSGDKAEIKRCAEKMLDMMKSLMATFEDEVVSGDFDEATKTLYKIGGFSTSLTQMNKVGWSKRLSHAGKTLQTLKNNKNINRVWTAALSSAHKLKKEGKDMAAFSVTIEGSNWRFVIHHGKEGGMHSKIDGDTVNIIDIERSLKDNNLKKKGIVIDKDQKDYLRALILKIILKNHPDVSLVAE